MPCTVLHIDNHVLVLDKPAPLATMGALPGEPTAVEWARDYLKHRFQKPGNVFVGVVSRLDAFVTGVLPLARTSKGAARLTQAFAENRVRKTYVALVNGDLAIDQGHWCDRLWHDDGARRVRVVTDERGQAAELHFQVVARFQQTTLLAIRLITGRKHQIRVQTSARDVPIVGDSKYGAPAWKQPGIALHAARLAFPHPTREETIDVSAPLPEYWPKEAREAWSSWSDTET